MVLSHSGASKRVGKRWNGFFVSISLSLLFHRRAYYEEIWC